VASTWRLLGWRIVDRKSAADCKGEQWRRAIYHRHDPMTRVPAHWLTLLSPLPREWTAARRAVAPPDSPQGAPGSPIAGWQSLTIDRTDGPFGTRLIHVTVDATGTPVAASDHVHLRDVVAGAPAPQPVLMRQYSVGGRIEADGSFRGTHWTTEGPEPVDDEQPQWQMTPRPPTDAEVAALLAIVRDVVARPSSA
jgi:hypothetical protein